MRHRGSESEIAQSWHVVHPDGRESLTYLECSAKSAFDLWEVLKSAGYSIRIVEREEACEIAKRVEAA